MTAFTKVLSHIWRPGQHPASRMDWFRGLRAAFALCVPLTLGDLAGLSVAGGAALGGFEAIADAVR